MRSPIWLQLLQILQLEQGDGAQLPDEVVLRVQFVYVVLQIDIKDIKLRLQLNQLSLRQLSSFHGAFILLSHQTRLKCLILLWIIYPPLPSPRSLPLEHASLPPGSPLADPRLITSCKRTQHCGCDFFTKIDLGHYSELKSFNLIRRQHLSLKNKDIPLFIHNHKPITRQH